METSTKHEERESFSVSFSNIWLVLLTNIDLLTVSCVSTVHSCLVWSCLWQMFGNYTIDLPLVP